MKASLAWRRGLESASSEVREMRESVNVSVCAIAGLVCRSGAAATMLPHSIVSSLDPVASAASPAADARVNVIIGGRN